MAKKTSESTSKTLFDHLNAINQIQSETYFDKLTDADKKTWSTFMLNRYISMEPEYIELVNDLQVYTLGLPLKPNLVYRIFISILPKTRAFFSYIKNRSEVKYSDELISIVMKYYLISKNDALEYIKLYYNIGRKDDLKKLLEAHAYDDKQISKILKA